MVTQVEIRENDFNLVIQIAFANWLSCEFKASWKF